LKCSAGKGGRRSIGPITWEKVNVHLSSLVMKVPDHVYVLG
jgi:hypothetical protein